MSKSSNIRYAIQYRSPYTGYLKSNGYTTQSASKALLFVSAKKARQAARILQLSHFNIVRVVFSSFTSWD